MKVEVTRDFLDYLEAFASLGSLLLAVIAGAFAYRSSRDSERSAAAAERTAEAATEEAMLSREVLARLSKQLEIEQATREDALREQRRRPVLEEPNLAFTIRFDPNELPAGILLDLGVELELGSAVTGIYPAVVRAEFVNGGDRDAEHALASIAVAKSVTILSCGARGECAELAEVHPAPAVEIRGGDAQRHGWRIDHMPPDQVQSRNLMLILPDTREHEVVLRIEQSEARAKDSRYLVSPDGIRFSGEETSRSEER